MKFKTLSKFNPFKWDEWRGGFDGNRVMYIKHLFTYRGYGLDLHKICGVDDVGCFHTHSARSFRLVLWGGYVEEVYPGDEPGSPFFGDLMVWVPFMFGWVDVDYCHRVVSLMHGKGPSYSLWWHTPRSHKVKLVGDGWAKQKHLTDEGQSNKDIQNGQGSI